MNAFFSDLYRDLTCAIAATAISLILAGSFVHSTATPPGTQAHTGVLTVPPGGRA
jgi:hypothetical protein